MYIKGVIKAAARCRTAYVAIVQFMRHDRLLSATGNSERHPADSTIPVIQLTLTVRKRIGASKYREWKRGEIIILAHKQVPPKLTNSHFI